MGKSDDEATELALRAAFLCDRKDGESLDLKSVLSDAKKYCKQFSGSGNLKAVISEVADSASIQEAAIKTAFGGLKYVYERVSEERDLAHDKKDELLNEIEAGFASFRAVKQGELSSEDRSMRAFYALADNPKAPWLIRYLGITKKEVKQDLKDTTYYRVLPLFKVSKDASQSLASPSMLDEVRKDINLFLGVELPEVLDLIEARVRKTTPTGISLLNTDLNAPRLARIFILALGRLLWGLSHQVDLKSRLPSTTRTCFERCSRAQIYINSILNSNKAPCLANETKNDKCLIDFIRSADGLIKDLRHAYNTEQLHELNMEDLTNSAYKSLDILTEGIFTLLYRRHDAGEKKYLPDETAALALKNDLAALTRSLKADDSRLEPFRTRASLVPDVDFLNKKATTLIDVLIIFCHLPHSDRKALMDELNARRNEEGKEVEWASQLALRLKRFGKRFITPVEYAGQVYKDASEPFNPHSFFSKSMTYHQTQVKAKLEGQRLIPFLTLLMATRCSTAYALSGEKLARSEGLDDDYLDPNFEIHRSGWQQLQAINEQAKNQAKQDGMKENTEERAYFSCSMSLFMYASGDVNPQLDVLPELHDRMRDLAHLLDLVFKMQKQLSKNQIFNNFFIECLDWVSHEQARLSQVIAQLKTESKDGVNRYIQEILLPMELDLTENFKKTQQAAKDSKRIVSDSKFIERMEENSAKDIEDIHKLVSKLFNKDSKLLQLISKRNAYAANSNDFIPPPTTPRRSVSQSSSEGNRVTSRFALMKLMNDSYKSMSYISRFYSKKGPLLSALIAELSLKSVLTDDELHDYLEKLIRIAASYRKTSFFPFVEARYGETTTMKEILLAMGDAETNKFLPFSVVIFGRNKPNLSSMPHEDIIEALDQRRKKNQWEHSEDEIEDEDFLSSSNPGSPNKYTSKADYREKYNNLRKQKSRRFSGTLFPEDGSENPSDINLNNLSGKNSSSSDSLDTEERSKDSSVHFG